MDPEPTVTQAKGVENEEEEELREAVIDRWQAEIQGYYQQLVEQARNK